MNSRAVLWTLGAVASLAAHAALLLMLALAVEPDPPPEATPPEASFDITSYPVQESEAEEQQPDADRAAEGTATGARASSAEIPQSTARAAPLPTKGAAEVKDIGDRIAELDDAADRVAAADPETPALAAQDPGGEAAAAVAPDTNRVRASASPAERLSAAAVPASQKVASARPVSPSAAPMIPDVADMAPVAVAADPVASLSPETAPSRTTPVNQLASAPREIAPESAEIVSAPPAANRLTLVAPDAPVVAATRAAGRAALPVVPASLAMASVAPDDVSSRTASLVPDAARVALARARVSELASVAPRVARTKTTRANGPRVASVALEASPAPAGALDAEPAPAGVLDAEPAPAGVLDARLAADVEPDAPTAPEQSATAFASASSEVLPDMPRVKTAAPEGPVLAVMLPDAPRVAPGRATGDVAPPVAPDAPGAEPRDTDEFAAKPPSLAIEAERQTAALAWSGGAEGQLDPVSLAAIQSFAQAGDPAPGAPRVRDEIGSLLATIPCARLQTVFDPDTGELELRGHLPEDGLREPVLSALKAQVGGAIPLRDSAMVLPRPICGVLAGIDAVGLAQSEDQEGDPRVVGDQPFAQVVNFREGDELGFSLRGPDYPAHFYVDYFDAEGQVLHLQPNEYVPLRKIEAEADEVIGLGPDGLPAISIVVSAPFGQEIMVAFAATTPLYQGVRPVVEPAGPYLDFLKEAVARVEQTDPNFRGEWFYFISVTAPR